MKFTGLVPLLRTHDLPATVAFYRDVLGMECVAHMDDWAALAQDDVEIMVATPNAHQPFENASFTGSLYFRCEDVDAMWNKLKAKVSVVYPLENFDYGMREFAIRDNNGYLLQFGTPLEDE